MNILSREPAGKAQLISAVTALVVYALQRQFRLLPEEADLLAPIAAYVIAQVVGWLWARGFTTPVDDPVLPEGTDVTTTDPATGAVTGTKTV